MYTFFTDKNHAPALFPFGIFYFGLALLVLVCLPSANAATPQSGDIYMAGSTVEYPARGLSFIMPGSATGTASEGHPDFEMFVTVQPPGANSVSDGSLHLLAGKANFQTVAAELDDEAMIENGLKVIPTGKATVLKGGIAYNDFKIQYEDELKAFIMAVIDNSGNGLMLFAIAMPDVMPAYKKAMFELARSVKTTRVAKIAQQPKPESSVTTESRTTANHAHEVVGVWMRRTNYSRSGIYIENSNKWAFAADGSVAWGSGAVVAGGTDGVSIRGGGDNPPDYGRWSTQGNTLKIHWDDGSNGEWTFSNFEYDGSPYLALTAQDGTVYRYRKVD